MNVTFKPAHALFLFCLTLDVSINNLVWTVKNSLFSRCSFMRCSLWNFLEHWAATCSNLKRHHVSSILAFLSNFVKKNTDTYFCQSFWLSSTFSKEFFDEPDTQWKKLSQEMELKRESVEADSHSSPQLKMGSYHGTNSALPLVTNSIKF